jgi:hypothetical protein
MGLEGMRWRLMRLKVEVWTSGLGGCRVEDFEVRD